MWRGHSRTAPGTEQRACVVWCGVVAVCVWYVCGYGCGCGCGYGCGCVCVCVCVHLLVVGVARQPLKQDLHHPVTAQIRATAVVCVCVARQPLKQDLHHPPRHKTGAGQGSHQLSQVTVTAHLTVTAQVTVTSVTVTATVTVTAQVRATAAVTATFTITVQVTVQVTVTDHCDGCSTARGRQKGGG